MLSSQPAAAPGPPHGTWAFPRETSRLPLQKHQHLQEQFVSLLRTWSLPHPDAHQGLRDTVGTVSSRTELGEGERGGAQQQGRCRRRRREACKLGRDAGGLTSGQEESPAETQGV